jgi:hypothetical protein
MKVSESLHRRAVSALWIEENEGHWRSTLFRRQRAYQLRDGVRRISQLLVLRTILLGDPVGQLSNACGRSECVNPYHYRDQSEREQSDWRAEECNGKELLDRIADGEGNRFMQIVEIVTKSDILINNVYGMTNDMGCYHCGKRFDPLAHRNQVICPECWTDEDQAEAEASLVD